jgi:hypothetical protein
MISYQKEILANERIRDLIQDAHRQRLARLATDHWRGRRSWRSTLAFATTFVRRIGLGRVAEAS